MAGNDGGCSQNVSKAPTRRKANEKPDGPTLCQTPGYLQQKYLKTFTALASSEGTLTFVQVQDGLAQVGLAVTASRLRRAMAQVPLQSPDLVSVKEFLSLTQEATKLILPSRTAVKVARQYFAPEIYSKYLGKYEELTADGGVMTEAILQDFFRECNPSGVPPPEKIKQILKEVDEDGNGVLDENEFFTLVIKAPKVNKRKVGPGYCTLASLVEEGWRIFDYRRIGYCIEDFLEAGFQLDTFIDAYSALEFKQAGVTLKELVAAGWNLVGARAAGYTLEESLAAGCSVKLVRAGGWDDVPSVVAMRKRGLLAEQLKLGGFSISELRAGGFAFADLRLAGFAGPTIMSLQRLRNKAAGLHAPKRQTTLDLRALLREVPGVDDKAIAEGPGIAELLQSCAQEVQQSSASMPPVAAARS